MAISRAESEDTESVYGKNASTVAAVQGKATHWSQPKTRFAQSGYPPYED